MADVKILYEDVQIIVCVKPAGMASQAERSSAMDLVSWLKNYIGGQKRAVGGQKNYIGVVHRLDKPVGGVMVYAKTPKAASELSRQFSAHDTEKTYLAVLTGRLPETSGVLENRLERDGRTNTSSVVDTGGKQARLEYRVLAERDGWSLVEVRLYTGRHHQIRVQMAHAGAGIYGDMKYNREATEKWNRERETPTGSKGLGLFSCGLIFSHPATGKRMKFKVLPGKGPAAIDEWPGLSYYMNDENEPGR